jgi:transposase-like protein
MSELLSIRNDIEEFCSYLGVKVMTAFMEHEARQKTGPWGRQAVYRHGTQPGYVIYHGRKLPIQRPRLRDQNNQEVSLQSYRIFQSAPRLETAVARKLIRNCSTRHYQGALEELRQGYGIHKSSVSRRFKACSARQLQLLLRRPVPADLVALIIDGQHFARHCVTVAMGIDQKGHKHVLGLWHGATENATVGTSLLEDLQARGLNPTEHILAVLDGSKALRKAVQTVLGDRAVVQRCRVHKQRNVVEHLPKEKQGQAVGRLRAAWDQQHFAPALKQLRKVVQWLQPISPTAARSLEEGLEETITLQKLHINETLHRTFSSTNMIESCFAQVELITSRVKHWRDGSMVLRWAAAALLFAEARFRRIKGVEQLGALVESLQALSNNEQLEAEAA